MCEASRGIEVKSMTVYDVIRDRLLEAIDTTGMVPWRKTWNCRIGRPMNVVSGKHYRGINIVLLAMSPTPFFATAKQWKEMGCTIKPGIQSYACVFYTQVRRTEEQEKKTGYKGHMPRAYSLLRYYNVICSADVNLSESARKRIAKLEGDRTKTPFDERSDYKVLADEIIRTAGVQVMYGDPACAKGHDLVRLPDFQEFESEYEYLHAVTHEIIHWTGHYNQLNRSPDNSYAYEELIAEIGSVFLINALGIDIKDNELQNNAAYVNGWYSKLKSDERCVNMILTASSQAQKACDYILTKMNIEVN